MTEQKEAATIRDDYKKFITDFLALNSKIVERAIQTGNVTPEMLKELRENAQAIYVLTKQTNMG